MAYLHRFLVPGLLLAVGLLSIGCSPATDEPNANIVGIEAAPRAGSASSTDVQAVPVSAPQSLAPFTEDDVFDAVNTFVDTRDAVVAGTTSSDALNALVSPRVLADVHTERDKNLANLETHSVHARVSYTTFPYVLDVQRAGDQIAAVTCSERWSERRTGAHQVVFVDQAMLFDIVDGALQLTEVRTAHDGERASEGLTCFVGIMGERALDAARNGVDALEAISADPALAHTTDFEALFSAVAYDSFSVIPDTVDMTRRRVSPVEVTYTPLGIDPSKGIDFIGAVSVCRYYPEGVYDEVIATGERLQVNDAYAPGTSVEDIVYVHIEPKRRSQGGVDHFWDFTADVSRDCWS